MFPSHPILSRFAPVDTRNPVNRQHPLNRGRVAWWLSLPSLMGGNKFYDLTGLNHGTLTNMTTSASGWRGTTQPGGFGHLLFDGVDDFVSCGNPAFAGGASQLTFACTFCASSFSDYAGFFGKQNNGSTDDLSCILGGASLGNNQGLAFVVRNGANSYGYTAGSLLTAGVWYRVHWVFDGSQTGNANRAKIYLNGIQQSLTFSWTIPTTTTTNTIPLTIGKESTFLFAGAINDATIFVRALSAADVFADCISSSKGHPGALNRVPLYSASSPAFITQNPIGPFPGFPLPLLVG